MTTKTSNNYSNQSSMDGRLFSAALLLPLAWHLSDISRKYVLFT